MKFLLGILTLLILMGLAFSCKSIKSANKLTIQYNILLKKDLVGDYIENEYKLYNASNVKRSSRSKNQYRVSFTETQENLVELENLLSKDEKITKYSKIEPATEIKVQNSSNVKKN